MMLHEAKNVNEALHAARQRLARCGTPSPALDARVLAMAALEMSHEALIAHGDEAAPAEGLERLDQALSRRAAGEPVSRIVGEREFHGLRLAISPHVLDPRPDSETLVEVAVALAARLAPQAGGALRIADLGAGSGAIAIALAKALPDATVLASDISSAALAVVRANSRRHGVSSRIETVCSDWWQDVSGAFDVVVSNPPYIRSGDVARLPREVRLFDPVLALDGGEDGLDAYRRIVAGVREHVKSRFAVAFEVGLGQAASVAGLIGAALPEAEIVCHEDLAGRQRVVSCCNLS